MDCLVTKLKGTVNDNSLLPLGGMLIHVEQQEEQTAEALQLNLSSSVAQTISVVGGMANLTLDSNMASGWVSSIELKAGDVYPRNVIYCKNGTYDILVPNKYALIRIGDYDAAMDSKAISVDIDDLKYSNDLHLLHLNSNLNKGDLSSLQGKSFGLIEISSQNITGDINEFLENVTIIDNISESKALTFRRAEGLYGTINPSKNIDKLGTFSIGNADNIIANIDTLLLKMPNLEKLGLYNCPQVTGNIGNVSLPLTSMTIYGTGVTGKIEDFVAKQRAAGRTSGTCSNGGWWGNTITFKNAQIAYGQDTLEWTPTTIKCMGESITA